MPLQDAVIHAGPIPPDDALQKDKKRYSELLSHHLALEVANGLRNVGFPRVKPEEEIINRGRRRGEVRIVKEKEFQGGLGPKRVDVSFSDDRHGLLLAVTIKSLNFPSYPVLRDSDPPRADLTKVGNFSKNVKNRFGDLTTESITLHMRFPFAVVGCLYVMPERSMIEKGRNMRISTFERASILYGTISGRTAYGDPAEKFEDVTLMLYKPMTVAGGIEDVWVKLYVAGQIREVTSEADYFQGLRTLYNLRNPHAMVGEEADEGEIDFDELSPDDDPQN